MTAYLKWHGDAFLAYTERQLAAGMDAGRIELQAIARQKASIPNTGVPVKIKRKTKGGNATQRTTYPRSSKPGESPRRRTGFGQKNIVSGIRSMTGRVGYTRAARYMTFHELGIRYARVGLQQRPTLIPALRDNQARLVHVIARAAQAVRP